MSIRKCLTEQSLSSMPSLKKIWIKNKFCDLESDVSPVIECDHKYKYRREDGKCNNLVKTNWGSSYHCLRRLLPPDYADGVSAPRVARDGSALPNPGIVSEVLLQDIHHDHDNDSTLLKLIWMQFISQDTFKTKEYLDGAVQCCERNDKFRHPECYSNDRFSGVYNQTCNHFVRQIGCRTCSLGKRAIN